MAFSRYSRTTTAKVKGKSVMYSSRACYIIFNAVSSGAMVSEEFVLSQGMRLDTVSANYYGDASYWWVIAAASGIGWQCQVPPGTLLKVPVSIADVANLVG